MPKLTINSGHFYDIVVALDDEVVGVPLVHDAATGRYSIVLDVPEGATVRWGNPDQPDAYPPLPLTPAGLDREVRRAYWRHQRELHPSNG